MIAPKTPGLSRHSKREALPIAIFAIGLLPIANFAAGSLIFHRHLPIANFVIDFFLLSFLTQGEYFYFSNFVLKGFIRLFIKIPPDSLKM